MRNATKQLRLSGANDDIRLSPRIAIWENVPGAFSSNNGEDFRCVLEELARIENPEVSIPKPKKWMPSGVVELPNGCISWRTHDAQYWGVPQRRRRISLVVDFRDEPRPEIQFIPEGLSRNIEQSEQTGEEITGAFGESVDTAVCIGNGQLHDALTPSDVCKTLNTLDDPMKVVCVGNGQLSQAELSEKVGALNCMHDQQALLCYGLDRASFNQGQNAKYDISIQEDIAQPLVARGPGGVMQTR